MINGAHTTAGDDVAEGSLRTVAAVPDREVRPGGTPAPAGRRPALPMALLRRVTGIYNGLCARPYVGILMIPLTVIATFTPLILLGWLRHYLIHR